MARSMLTHLLSRLTICSLVSLLVLSCSADRSAADSADATEDSAAVDATGVADDLPVEGTDSDAPSPPDAGSDPPSDAAAAALGRPVAGDACCLALTTTHVAWIDGGVVTLADRASGAVEILERPGRAADLSLGADRIIWAESVGDHLDLFERALSGGEVRAVVAAPGDQTRPTLDGGWLAWVDRREPPHDAARAEIWVMQLDEVGSARAVTDDDAEQDHPHLRGHRVVWTDYANDVDGVYVDVADPNENDSDILGWDLRADEGFVVIEHPAKQSRPAIDGDTVVWLDWRERLAGPGPEPKYAAFELFAQRLGAAAATRLGEGAWSRPTLWRRPAIDRGRVAWIEEAVDGGAPGPDTRVRLISLEATGAPRTVVSATGLLEAIELRGTALAWLGAGRLAIEELSD